MQSALSRSLLAATSVAVLGACVSSSDAQTSRGKMSLAVDATDATRGVLHAHLVIPARGTTMKLQYPKWIPGEHGPTGPVQQVVGLKMTSGGAPVSWRRDSDDMFLVNVDLPAGAKELEVDLDFLLPGEGRFSSGASSTSQLLDLSWNQVAVYPRGASDDWTVTPRLRLPAGWKFGTSLAVAKESASGIEFQPVSLTTLVDSTVIAGAHFRTLPLPTIEGATHQVDIVADSDAALDVPAARVAAFERLVTEAHALFGAHHYDGYHFLLTLSDHVASFGLEHHSSSDNRVAERALIDDAKWADEASLLPHEFVHSWNGKYRRPEGLATGDYHTPMRGDLLWIYEGLTNYLGSILTPRSGLQTPEQWRDGLALDAAALDHRPGREWRTLEDTAIAAQLLYNVGGESISTRRSVDFYAEGTLVWLEADVLIRQKTGNERSLDDFCKRFHGGKNSSAQVRPYNLEDVVSALDAVVAYDWKKFLADRISSRGPGAPLGGIEGGGWRVTYRDTPTEAQKSFEGAHKTIDLRSSVGLVLTEDANVLDVVPGSPAAKAGLATRMKVIAVNERRFSGEVLHDAIRAAKTSGAPIAFLTESSEFFRTFPVEYKDGERYPALERDPSKPDLLAEIIKPRVPVAVETPEKK